MDHNQQEDRPLGPVEFMNRALIVLGAFIAAVLIYFGTWAVLSLERVPT